MNKVDKIRNWKKYFTTLLQKNLDSGDGCVSIS